MHKHPRSIEELYDEAVAARAKYPEHTRMNDQPSIPTERPGEWTGETIPPSPAIDGQPVSRAATNTVPDHGRAVRRDRNVIPAGATQYEAGPRVSEIFEETEVRQAIQILATQAGQSVVVDDRVSGATSAHIENEPFESALKKILLPLGFVFRRQGDQYLIGVIDQQSAMFSQIAETLEFRPMHLAPMELVQLLPESLKKYVQVIEKRNLMLIEAPEDVAQRIALRLEESDRPVPQVILEAMVCVINPSKTFQFNVDAKQSLTVDGKDLLNVGLTGLAFTGNGTPAGVKNAFSDFALTSVFLRLLAQEGYVTIRAAPRVMAKDGEKATISINRETFFSVQSTNGSFLFQSNLQQIDAGITLDIVPVVRGDTVTVHIERAEVSEPIRQQDQSSDSTVKYPLINRRRVATTVHVQDGQTIVIGGLTQRQTIDRVSRIPYLGDIPYVGRLFQYIDQEDAEAEVVIFIAPRIVNPLCAEPPAPGLTVPAKLPVPTMPRHVPVPPAPAPDFSSSSFPAFNSNAKSSASPSNSAVGGTVKRLGPAPSTRTAPPAHGADAPATSPPRLTGPASERTTTQSAQPPRKTPTTSPVTPPASTSSTKPSGSEAPAATSAANSPANPSEASNTAPRELRFLAPKVVMPPADEQPDSSE